MFLWGHIHKTYRVLLPEEYYFRLRKKSCVRASVSSLVNTSVNRTIVQSKQNRKISSRIRGDFTWNVLETEVHLDLPLKTTSECTSFFNGEYRKLKFLGKDFYGEPIWRCQFQWSFHGSKDFEMHGGKNIEANGRFGVMVTPLSCNLREIIIWLMVNNALHIMQALCFHTFYSIRSNLRMGLSQKTWSHFLFAQHLGALLMVGLWSTCLRYDNFFRNAGNWRIYFWNW